MFFKTRRVSVEAMKHRFGDHFMNEVAAGFREIRALKASTKTSANHKKIEDAVDKYFGVKVTLKIVAFPMVNAYVVPPDVTTNGFMFDSMRRHYTKGKDALNFLKSNSLSKMVGGYDPKSGRVTGDFSKLVSEIAIFTGTLNSKLSDMQIAAIFAHEVGHILSMFETLTKTYTSDLVLDTIVREFIGTDSQVMKVELMQAGLAAVGGESISAEEVSKIPDDKEAIAAVFIDAVSSKPTSLMNSALHDMRNWEMAADQFVSRLGYGHDLALALDHMHGWDISKLNPVLWFFINYYRTMSALTAIPTIWIVYMLTRTTPDTNYYDDYPNRLRRIKNDGIAALKNREMSPEDTKRVLRDLDGIDEILMTTKDREFMIDKIMRFLIPGASKQKKIMDRQKMFEELGNNQLFSAAAKLRTLSIEEQDVDDEVYDAILTASEESMNALDKTFEQQSRLSAALSQDASLEAYRDHVAGLESSMIAIIAASLAALAGIFYTIFEFFNKNDAVGTAEGYVEDITTLRNAKSESDRAEKLAKAQLEDNAKIARLMSIPVVGSIFDQSVGKGLQSFMHHSADMIDDLMSKPWIKNLNNIDRELDRIDKMSHEEMAIERNVIENDFSRYSQSINLLKRFGAEMGLDPLPKDAKILEELRYYNQVLSIAGSPQPEKFKPNMDSLNSIDWSKMTRTASDLQSKIGAVNKYSKDAKSISVSLNKAAKKIEGMDNQDISVDHFQTYLGYVRQLVAASVRLSKLYLIMLKGQRDVLNTLHTLNKENKK